MNSDVLRKYTPFWSKYRPVILKMMQGAPNGPQQYQFMSHELDNGGKKPKGGYAFRMVTNKGGTSSTIRGSEIAQDLLNVIKASQTGSALLAVNEYEIVLDKNLKLQLSQQNTAVAAAPEAPETEKA